MKAALLMFVILSASCSSNNEPSIRRMDLCQDFRFFIDEENNICVADHITSNYVHVQVDCKLIEKCFKYGAKK